MFTIHSWTEIELNPTWVYLESKGARRTPPIRSAKRDPHTQAEITLKLNPTWVYLESKAATRTPNVCWLPNIDVSWSKGWTQWVIDAKLQIYQVGAHFKALDEGVLLVSLDSRYTQVGFNIISVQMWIRGRMSIQNLVSRLTLRTDIFGRFCRVFHPLRM